MRIRHAVEADLPRLMEIYAYARDFMAAHGNPTQWGPTHWPPQELIRQDIECGKSYVCEENGRIAGVFYYDFGKDIEPAYNVIEDGSWKDDSPYGVIHRIAGDGSVKGVGAFCINWALTRCGHLRIDTHPDNKVMQNLLAKLGFERRGIIHVPEDEYPRFAYEKSVIRYPDYDRCLVNLACSVAKEFHVTPPNASLPECDRLFHGQKNVVLLVLDGMGTAVMEGNLDKDGFLRSHQISSISSVFPSTTVAATTSLRSGLYPIQHSWLGWDCYFHQLDRNVSVFPNTFSETDIPAAPFSIAESYIPYQSVVQAIRLAGGDARELADYKMPNPKDFDAFFDTLSQWCGEPGRKYIYAYLEEPDHTMHAHGCYGHTARRTLRMLERKIRTLSETLTDTLLLITADHGHIDLTEKTAIQEDPVMADCLLRAPSLEPRAINFFIKKGREQEFEQHFRSTCKEAFRLFSREEFLSRELFGKGTPHPQALTMLGDYIAAGTGRSAIFNTPEEKKRFTGHHTGLTQEEMTVPLIAADL